MDRFEHLPCALLITDSTGQILEANRELLALVGQPKALCRTQPMAALLSPASRTDALTGLSNRRALDIVVSIGEGDKVLCALAVQWLTLGADKALYEAKAAWRNRTVHFN
jgi:PleD family two-component response regulator